MRNLTLSIAAIGVIAVAAPAMATTTVVPTTAAASSFVGYPASDAIDTGPGSEVTDWAAASTGVGSVLDLTLAQAYTLSAVNVTDRVTSGGANGAFHGGTTDFTTSFTIQLFTDGTFTTTASDVYSFSKSVLGDGSTIADFDFVGSLPDITGQFIQYTVTGTNGGANPGVSNIEFSAVPESATWAMMLVGFGLIGAAARRRQTVRVSYAN